MHGADRGRGHGQLWQMLERIGPGTAGKMLDGMTGAISERRNWDEGYLGQRIYSGGQPTDMPSSLC